MDWTTPGRIDSFEFEKIKINNLSKSLGKITGVTEGTLTFGYDTELKVSGTLTVVNTNFVNNCLIRVWYKPTLNGKTEKIELCTCFAKTSEMSYDNGMWSGTINLRSVLARHIDDELAKNYVIAKGKRALSYFDNMFKWLGGAAVRSGVKNKKYTKNVVYEMGKRPMDVLQGIADFVGGQITCDTHGRTVLQKYVAPGKKTVSYTLPSGSYSVTLPGLSFEDSTAGTVNRVGVKYTYNNKTIWGLAKAASSSNISYAKQGRHITRTFTLNSMSPKTKARANAVAKSKLYSESTRSKYWKLKCYYLPITALCLKGGVVRFRYGTLDIDALVYSVDMDLSPGGMLDVTLKEVRRRGSL